MKGGWPGTGSPSEEIGFKPGVSSAFLWLRPPPLPDPQGHRNPNHPIPTERRVSVSPIREAR